MDRCSRRGTASALGRRNETEFEAFPLGHNRGFANSVRHYCNEIKWRIGEALLGHNLQRDCDRAGSTIESSLDCRAIHSDRYGTLGGR